MKPDKDCLFTAILQQVHHWANQFTLDMLCKQMVLHMIKHPHVFYSHVLQELLKNIESYESYVRNIFNGTGWGEWICTTVMCHMWNVAVGIVMLYRPTVINMYHKKSKCEIILIANRWPEQGERITHYSASVHINEDPKQLLKFNQKGIF